MKIGILTFHKPINYGAFLQAYSLSSFLKSYFPEDSIEIIDYIAPKEKHKIYINLLRELKHNGLIYAIREIKKINVFKQALHELPLSSWSYSKSNLKQLFRKIDNEYDLLIVGSDAIFNWNQNGFPTAFIPEYDFKKCKVISYGASVHGLRFMEELSSRINSCQKAFHNFEFIGVRDECTKDFVKYCSTTSNPIHTCDPTLLIDPPYIHEKTQQKFDLLLTKFNFLRNDYIVFMVENSSVSRIVKQQLGNDYPIVSLFKPNPFADYYLYDIGPFEWFEIIGHASLVVTSYFHGSLISFIQGVPAIVVDCSKYDAPYEGKLHDLMITRLDLPDLYFRNEDLCLPDNMNRLNQTIYYSLSGKYLDRMKESISIERNNIIPLLQYLESR